MRDVGVLKFVDQDVAVTLLQFFAQGVVFLQEFYRSGNQRAEGDAFFLAQQVFAGAVGARNFLLQRDVAGPLGVGVFVQAAAFGFEFRGQAVGVALEVRGGNQFILAAAEKFHEVVEELSRIGDAAVFIQAQARQIPSQQDPVIALIEDHALGIDFYQQRFAEGMKRGEGYVFAALADGFHHAGFHFAGGFFGERQAEDIFAREPRIGFQQVANSFGDDACFSRAGAGDDQQRTLSMGNGALLRVIYIEFGPRRSGGRGTPQWRASPYRKVWPCIS